MSLTAMSKVNFWNKLRVDHHLRYIDLAEKLGGSESRWGAYFSGQTMPNPTSVRQLCDLFEVDYDTGYQEFAKAHAVWSSSAHSQRRYITNGHPETSAKITSSTPDDIRPDTQVKIHPDVLAILYGNIQYDVFVNIQNMVADSKVENIPELIYGKISYEDYCKILELLSIPEFLL